MNMKEKAKDSNSRDVRGSCINRELDFSNVHFGNCGYIRKWMLVSTLTLFLFCFLAIQVYAANYYVRPPGGSYGLENGSDWNNAFNGWDGVAWGIGTGQVGSGDTLYVAGGRYNQSLTYGASGTNNIEGDGLIVIRRATVNEHGTDTGWNDGFEQTVIFGDGKTINPSEKSYVKIDGVTNSGIKLSAAGYTGSPARAINYQNGESYLTFQYIWIDGTNNNADFRGVRSYHYGVAGQSTKCVFRHMKFTNMSNDVFALYDVADYLFEYIEATVQSSTLGRHADLIECERAGAMVFRFSDIDFRADQIHIGMGVGEGKLSGPWYIYGNVFRNANSAFKVNSKNPEGNGPVYFFNNVIVNSYGTAIRTLNGTTFIAFNNIFRDNAANGTTGTYAYISGPNPFLDYVDNPAKGGAQGDFRLNPTASGCINAGVKLSNEPWWNATYVSARDAYGNTRGGDGIWDIGAYEYVSGPQSGTANPIPAPTGLTILD